MQLKEMLDKIKEYEGWPKAFEEGDPMWDDEYISSHMLRAHLDESHDKASYHSALREKIAENIIKKCSLKEGDSVLDLGCGPGLYAKEFAKRGIYYTGIDISNQSLGYAMAHRGHYSDKITYIKGDYTGYVHKDKFDCVIMIWCDFGALSPEKRDMMLQNVRASLKENGSFLFDVYAISSPFEKSTISWKVEESGFWQAGLYLVLEKSMFYENVGAGLYSAVVISEKGVKKYRIWDKRYSKKELADVLKQSGFKPLSIKKGGLSGRQKDMYGVILKSNPD